MLVFLLMGSTVIAQESRGGITGKITDPQGAVVPGASVVVTNTETNVTSRTASNDTGYFEVNLLNPGTYSVAIEATGFRKTVRSGVELQVAGRLGLTIELQVGQVSETVEVTAAAPLLDTTTASGGRVIDNRQVLQLPFSDMNPFTLTALAPGMQWTGQPEYRRPFDNSGTSSFNTMGGVGQNEYMMDGAPVTGTDRRVGFAPSSDAVEEFKLETTSFDASYGHSSGATINVVTKAGTNQVHGSVYDQHWQLRWNATPHFTRLQNDDLVRQGKLSPTGPKQPSGRSNQFGGTLMGPIVIPKVVNGKDKLFFMLHYDGILQVRTETTNLTNRTVPRPAWRQGDFSDLLSIDAVKYTVYDPRSARLEGGRVVRTPFAGNKGVPVLDPVYKYYAPIYPQPNNVPGLATAEGVNNYYAGAMPKNNNFHAAMNRVDYNLAQNHRVFVRWYWNHRYPDEYDWTYETVRGLHTNNSLSLERINKGGGGDYVWAINSANILNITTSVTRFAQGGINSVLTSYKPSGVGLPSYMDQEAGQFTMLPQIQIGGMDTVGNGYPVIGMAGTTGELKAQMTSIQGNHSLKYGWQERRYWYTSSFPGNTSGVFSFDNTYLRQADNTTTASSLGLSWAAFMMGLPSSINVSTNDSSYLSTRYRAFYLQDDWRLSNRFRVTLGLRYEREGGSSERFNRAIGGGFDFTYKPPFASGAEAAFAKSPIPELAAADFKVLGGTQYLGQPNKTYTNGTHNLLPKLGVVYQVNSKTVVRAGYGWFYDTYNVNNDRPAQDGYTRLTRTTLSNDQGLTFCCGLGSIDGLSAVKNPILDPFPLRADGTRFDSAYGNSLGEIIRQGQSWTFVPRDFKPAWQQRWRVGAQREIARDIVLEASYNGSYARIPLNQPVSYVPAQFWATGNTRNSAVENNLNTNLPNPFNLRNFPDLQSSNPAYYRYLSTLGFFTGTTIRKYQLIRAYPNMNGLTGLRPGTDFASARGANKYRDLQLQLEKRFSKGLQTAVMYTYASNRTQDVYLNEFDSIPSWRPGTAARPHRFVWQAIYDMPFGKGRRWVTSGPVQHLVGGWTLSWIYQFQSGQPSSWSNRFFYGDQSQLGDLLKHGQVRSNDIHLWFDPSIAYRTGTGPIPSDFKGFDGRSAFQPAGWQVRAFPTRLDVLREDGIRNWDLKIDRRFRITERMRTSFSMDLLNATNHTNFEGPVTDPTSTNFGKVTTQRGLSRLIQFNLRLEF